MNARILLSALFLSVNSFVLAEQDASKGASEIVPSGSVAIEHAWIQAGDEEAIMLKAFAALRSDANTPWVLERVTARGFRMVMIHRMVLQDGKPVMALQSNLQIPPGETVQMDKDSVHLMFMGPRKHYKDGDKIKVAFHFKDQKPVTVFVPVLKSAAKRNK